jgi:hypothetical protein
MPDNRKESCETRISPALEGRLDDLWSIYMGNAPWATPGADLHAMQDYGLGFTYIDVPRLDGQHETFFHWQLSWDAPCDEFRFYVNPDLSCHHIEYWLSDYFDRAHRVLIDDAKELMVKLWNAYFRHMAPDVMPQACHS